jgi:two-component system cell cycle sensor histidine kinase/response regulator CckA
MGKPRQEKESEMILVIDSDPYARDIAGRFLEVMGYQALLARNGTEALEMFRQNNFKIQAVVLDVATPETAAEEIFKELRQLRSDLSIILCSIHPQRDLALHFAKDGSVKFLPKPLSFSKLELAVGKATRS